MKYNPFKTNLHTGKITLITVITNATVPLAVGTKWKDTIYYQVKGHNDYVQDNASK